MDQVIRIEDIKSYIQRRRNFLSTRRESAETPADKGKIIGMLQALADFEGMIRQLRVIPASSVFASPAPQNFKCSCDDLFAQWLIALNLPDACLDDFQDDTRQNRMIARHPKHKQGIVLLGQLTRNKALIDTILATLRGQAPQSPAGDSVAPARVMGGNGGTCPFCGKTYKYAKALASHVAGCPKKSSL